jgi:hypothetical protein
MVLLLMIFTAHSCPVDLFVHFLTTAKLPLNEYKYEVQRLEITRSQQKRCDLGKITL